MNADHARRRVLLCASGSVATIKVPEIAVRLSETADVCVVLTKAADFFLQRAKDYNAPAWAEFHAATQLPDGQQGKISVVRDENEWEAWNVVGDSVRHIEVRSVAEKTLRFVADAVCAFEQLKDWADVMLLAPMSANTLGKLANGLADNLLVSVGVLGSPFIFAPAMNTDMWNHPITAKQLRVLEELGYLMVPPVEKKLACGVVGRFGYCAFSIHSYENVSDDFAVGNGGLATVDSIVDFTLKQLRHLSLSE
ncbi:unnamed protein product [Phytophthora lilii]|uniref:Unnamed protein product n=1 Tax=Phytophthora lilii TaxID=2077276 RepID=A0A9W6X472_9STRA|nr:unnamed protein product [Phytophthora lilii]